ncbi:MAG: LamG domain-containing protein [Pseudomonadota bacterium]
MNDGLVAYYPFNGNANDESGNGNHGTVHGATLTSDRFGKANNAYAFNGVDDYLEISDSDSFDNIRHALTISLFVYASRYNFPGETWQGLIAKGNNPRPYSLYTRNDNKLHFSSSPNTPTNGGYDISEETIPLSKWTHVVVVFSIRDNIGYTQFFVDGFTNGEKFYREVSEITTDDYNVLIGRTYENRRFFQGVLDDLRIYNRAISESEVQQLYLGCQPSIDIVLNSNNRVTGDKVIINAHINGPDSSNSSCSQTKLVETVWVKLPDDSVIPLIEPFTGLTLLPGDDIDTKIFEYTFSGVEPIGAYEIGGRLLHPFSGDAISTDIEILTFSQ